MKTAKLYASPVYVETDHDTDADGKPGLSQSHCSITKAVAQGDFKAATILESAPRSGTLDETT